MSNSKRYYGSIDIDAIFEAAKSLHSSMYRGGKKNRRYGKATVWVSETPDTYGNSVSICLNPTEAAQKEGAKNVYFGNFKLDQTEAKPLGESDVKDLADDLPF